MSAESLAKWNWAVYLKTTEWKEKRQQCLDDAGHRCRMCNSSVDLQAHHRKYPLINGNEHVKDLTCLCSYCHWLFHRFHKVVNGEIKRTYSIQRGRIIKIQPQIFRSAAANDEEYHQMELLQAESDIETV